MGFINPALYKNSTLFMQDVTSGDNKCAGISSKNVVNCCSQGFTCTTGWDPVTGLGSVNYGKLEETYALFGEITRYASAGKSAAACGISLRGRTIYYLSLFMTFFFFFLMMVRMYLT